MNQLHGRDNPAESTSKRSLWLLLGRPAVLVVVMATAVGVLGACRKQPATVPPVAQAPLPATAAVATAGVATTAASPSASAPTQTPLVVITVIERIITATPEPATPTSVQPTPTTATPTATSTLVPATATWTATPPPAPTPTPLQARIGATTASPTVAVTPTVSVAAAAPGKPGDTPQPAAATPALTGHIVFTEVNDGEPDIMAVDVATKQVWRVHTWGSQPRLRADGRVLFNGVGGGKNDLITVLIDGSHELITTRHPEDAYPDWSPTGEGAVFYSTFDEGHNETIFVQEDVTKPSNVKPLQVRGWPALGRMPTWLKNGRIAYTGCDYWFNGSRCGVWSASSDGIGQPIRLSEQPGDQTTDSANGQVLYTSASSGNWEVYVVPENGGAAHNLSNNPSQDFGAAFSPDGRSIALASDRDGTWGIWILNADGSDARKLLRVPGGFGQNWQQERLSWGP